MRILLKLDRKMLDMMQKEKIPRRAAVFCWMINAVGIAFALFLLAKAVRIFL